MAYETSSWLDNLLSLTFMALAVQNILLLIAIPLTGESSFDESTVFSIALTVDLVCFLLLLLLGSLKLFQSDAKRNWLAIILGSTIFLYFSLFWRVNLEILPQAILDMVGGIFQQVDTPNTSGLEALSALLFSIRISNVGLLLVSLGLFFEYQLLGSYRYFILLYGLLNVIFVLAGALILFKFFTPVLVIPYWFKVAFHEPEEVLIEL